MEWKCMSWQQKKGNKIKPQTTEKNSKELITDILIVQNKKKNYRKSQGSDNNEWTHFIY